MFTGGGGNLPVPQSPGEWLALVIALVALVWAVKTWLDDD